MQLSSLSYSRGVRFQIAYYFVDILKTTEEAKDQRGEQIPQQMQLGKSEAADAAKQVD